MYTSMATHQLKYLFPMHLNHSLWWNTLSKSFLTFQWDFLSLFMVSSCSWFFSFFFFFTLQALYHDWKYWSHSYLREKHWNLCVLRALENAEISLIWTRSFLKCYYWPGLKYIWDGGVQIFLYYFIFFAILLYNIKCNVVVFYLGDL